MHQDKSWLCNVRNEQAYKEFVRERKFSRKVFMRGDPQEDFNVPGAYSQGVLKQLGYIGVYVENRKGGKVIIVCKKHGAPISYTEKDCPACAQIEIMEQEATLSNAAMREATRAIKRLKTEKTKAIKQNDGLDKEVKRLVQVKNKLQADLTEALWVFW